MIKRPSKVNDDLKVTYRTFVRNPFGLKGQPASQPAFLMAGADDARSDATADAAAAWLPRSAPRRGTFAAARLLEPFDGAGILALSDPLDLLELRCANRAFRHAVDGRFAKLETFDALVASAARYTVAHFADEASQPRSSPLALFGCANPPPFEGCDAPVGVVLRRHGPTAKLGEADLPTYCFCFSEGLSGRLLTDLAPFGGVARNRHLEVYQILGLAFDYLDSRAEIMGEMRRNLQALKHRPGAARPPPSAVDPAARTLRYLACLRLMLLRMLRAGIVFTKYYAEYQPLVVLEPGNEEFLHSAGSSLHFYALIPPARP